MLDGSNILYVDRARSFRRGQSKIDLGLHPGSRLPAYCTSMGKVLLAHLPEDEQRDLIAEMKLTKRGPNTITSKKALREELDEIAEASFAVNDEELAPELYSISAPVRSEAGEVARRREHGRARLDDLAGGARRRARPAAGLDGRQHQRASRLQA